MANLNAKGIPKGTRKLNNGPILNNGLTAQQEAYARARAMGMSTEEAVKAGQIDISIHTAHKWNKLTKVSERINELAAIATKNAIIKTGLDREWVLSRLMTVADRCMQAEPVLDKEGAPTGEYKFDASGANAALKMLGDTMGLFKPAEKKPEDDYANLSDDDITRIVAHLAAETGLIETGPGAKTKARAQQAIEVQAISKAG